MPARGEVVKRRVSVAQSGAQIVSVTPAAAEAFLDRLGAPGPDEIWLALAAMQDDRTMVGVAVVGATPADMSRIMVAVAPERRRLHIGTDLLHALCAEALQSDIHLLRISYPLRDVAADAFLSASGLVAGRQVLNDVVTLVLAK